MDRSATSQISLQLPKLQVAVCVASLVLAFVGHAAEPTSMPAQDAAAIRSLEKTVFQPALTAAEADALLKRLRDPAARAQAMKALIAGAAGMQDRIIAAVSNEADVDTREAAADVVEALDGAYRTSEPGKKLCKLYAAHADRLVPQAWQEFRKNPLDLRAAAILTSADADRTLAWITKNGDARDGLRFVLLRVREVPADKWAAKRYNDYTYQSFVTVIGDVFPGGSIKGHTVGMRVVGHTLLRHLWASPASGEAALPKLDQVGLARRLVYICRVKSPWFGERYCAFKIDPVMGSANDVKPIRPPFTTTYREYGVHAPVGLAPLPQLLFEKTHEHAWIQHSMGAPAWSAEYTPLVYRKQIGFASSASVAPPRVLESTTQVATASTTTSQPRTPKSFPKPAADAPTVVVLPPQLPLVVPADLRARAQQACDSLEEGLSSTGKLRVVNRADLDRVLRERSLAGSQSQPALSYDAMLRLSVSGDELLPKASLVLVDLSSGNPLHRLTVDWPVPEQVLSTIIGELPNHLSKGPPPQRQLKVRLMGVEQTQGRMGPLGLRLEKLFVDALRQSKGIVLLQHLEAASAQEESLLLLMGFTRLAGQRQFAPQADAMLELRIAESDVTDKAFADVPIEVSFRLQQGPKPTEAWTSMRGAVRDYDKLAKQAWDALARQLVSVDAGAGSKMLDDLATRRRQALLEVKAAGNVDSNLSDSEIARAKLDHLEAALKLDPLCEEAAFMRVACLWQFYGHQFTQYTGSKEVHELLLAAARYNDLFPQDARRNAQVQDYAWDAVRMTPPLLSLHSGSEGSITPDLRILLDRMKRMIEVSVHGDPRYLSRACPRFLPVVYRGMRLADVSLAQREAWMDSVLTSLRTQFKGIGKIDPFYQGNIVFGYYWIHIIAAQMAAEDDRSKRALELVKFVRTALDDPKAPACHASQRPDLVKQMRAVMIRLDDAAALAEFEVWVKARQTPVRAIWFGNLPGSHYSVYDFKDPFKPVKIAYVPSRNWPRPMAPLCEGGGYMYAMTWKDSNDISWSHVNGASGQGVSQEIVRIQLDAAGRPSGDPDPVASDEGRGNTWSTLEVLDQPKVNKYLQVLFAQYIDGKLYLGTKYSGLLIYDPAKNEWKVIDQAAGLPCLGVYSLHPQEDGTLFCTGRDETKGAWINYYFAYSLKNGEIRVLRKSDSKENITPNQTLVGLWKHDGKLRGVSDHSIVPDVMAADYRTEIQLGYNACYQFARVGERLFTSCSSELIEMEPTGKIKKRMGQAQWWVLPGFQQHWLLTQMDCPYDTPASGFALSDGRYLWFTSSLVMYDPQKETWHGPVMSGASSGYSVATSAGLWLGTGQGIWFIDREKYLAAAKQADRVTTTAEYIKRRDAAIGKMPPLPQARTLSAQRKYAQAQAVLEPYLKEHPDDPIAILLAGMIHDSWALNKLARADECYARLEAMSDPSAKFTGMYMRLHLQMQQKQWEQAQATIQRIRGTFPILDEEFERDVAGLATQVDKAIKARTTTTAPATGRAR